MFFWKEQNPQTDRAWSVLQAAAGKMSDWADVVAVQATDPAEKPLVDRFGTSRAPMPLVLAVAPCGAVTKAFTSAFDESQLRSAFVSPGTQLCLKALQDRKLVLLCVVDQAGPNGSGVPAAAQEFKADQRFGAASEIVLVSASDEGEAGFLKELRVDTRVAQAVYGLARSARQRRRPVRRSGEQGPVAGQTGCGPVEPVRGRGLWAGRMRTEEIGADDRVAWQLGVRDACWSPAFRLHGQAEACSNSMRRSCVTISGEQFMRMRTLVWREIFERKSQLVTSFLAILLGITVIVSIKNITFYSEKAVAREMDSLGANILIMPKSVTLQDYYAADMQGDTIPEEYVTQLAMSDLQGLDNLSPKLSVPVDLQGRSFTLTGILPKSEFQAKAAWAGAGIFTRPAGCGAMPTMAFAGDDKKTLVRQRVIENLEQDESLVGADVATALALKEGDRLSLLGREFKVTALLPQTGTIDDSRVFAHLHTVQELTDKGPVVSAIEVVGCCQEISNGLVGKINRLLPEAKVVTITQIADAQIKMNHMMSRLSAIFLVIIVVVGGAGIANYMFANVYERRREIGTLMSLGATSFLILRIFLLKALLLGIAGGVGGYLLGTVLAVVLGPKLAGVPVLPMPMLGPVGDSHLVGPDPGCQLFPGPPCGSA